MPLLFFKLSHSIDDVFSSETTVQIVFSSLKWSIVNDRQDVGVIAGSID
jgi:hypothetical protein